MRLHGKMLKSPTTARGVLGDRSLPASADRESGPDFHPPLFSSSHCQSRRIYSPVDRMCTRNPPIEDLGGRERDELHCQANVHGCAYLGWISSYGMHKTKPAVDLRSRSTTIGPRRAILRKICPWEESVAVFYKRIGSFFGWRHCSNALP
jgi:hypothetical protein